ncbi:succinate dehydrogenase assembly factor 2 [Bartonella sp. TP]|uniref:FAD assembly factor SdhE n=1 Tax=Bartonella sp. TP TaxID=3057550 RepID=UPI0025B0343C|nr:succinate dehydrogenase assembly factor 2 [Bartonella sp. TP]MDN5249729.1 succinate dehydrogenase assembly factor 2 [Alphaproteobacteria bacterium]WJW80056.1 succinate dehydrogenase assembly factor 2 [Bartonella sp. TP]
MENNWTARQKRLLFRAQHRGMKEMDIILGSYAKQNLSLLSDSQMDELEHIMSFEDRELFNCFIGECCVSPELNTPLFHDILSFSKRLR